MNIDIINNVTGAEFSSNLELEIKLNITNKGKDWANIGDYIYNFIVKRTETCPLYVNDEQWVFLEKLNNQSIEQIKQTYNSDY